MPAADIRGLKEFRRELKAIEGHWPRELTKVHRKIGVAAATRARTYASSGSRLQASAAGAIRGTATQSQARIGLSGSPPWAGPAFWGTKRHTGWYNKARYNGPDAPPQFPEWVGNAWQPAVAGSGPYAINNALAAYLPELLHTYDQMIVDLSKRAFDG